jgi:hypothetical protein
VCRFYASRVGAAQARVAGDSRLRPATTGREMERVGGGNRMLASMLAALLTLLFPVVAMKAVAVPQGRANSPVSAPSALLAEGKVGKFRWKVLVHREQGDNGQRRPCIEALTSSLEGGRPGGSSFSLCGSLREFPILLSKSSGTGRAERTVFAIAYRPEVTFVRVWLRGHRPRLIRLRMLGRHKAQRARVRLFRYAAFGIAHQFCLVRLTAYNARLDVVDRGPSTVCR